MTFIIAECGVNWRTLAEADKMIKESAHAGADACKFQAFTTEGYPIGSFLYEHSLKPEDIRYLYYRCCQNEIEFMCTPMYLEAVQMLDSYVKRWKIREKDHLNGILIDKCLKTGKELLISSQQLMSWNYNPCRQKISQLYCIPEYPPKDWPRTLDFKGFDGYSCHIPSWRHAALAVKHFNLDYLEIHVRLNEYCPQYEPLDQRVSINMYELRQLCKELE